MPFPHILLVEDDPAIALMYETKLKASGFDVTLKRDGVSAWQELQTGPRPDLVLLDVVLPKKDGFEILTLAAGVCLAPPFRSAKAFHQNHHPGPSSAWESGLAQHRYRQRRLSR